MWKKCAAMFDRYSTKSNGKGEPIKIHGNVPMFACITMLHTLFDYDPVTGFITHKTDRGWCKVGGRVGSPHPTGYLQMHTPKHDEGGASDWFCQRVAWVLHYGHWPKDLCHINGVLSDNRIVNLREVPN